MLARVEHNHDESLHGYPCALACGARCTGRYAGSALPTHRSSFATSDARPDLPASANLPAHDRARRVTSGVTSPRLIHTERLPDLKTTKLSARAQKVVVLMVVDRSGTPKDLRIVESADRDLSGRVLAAVNLYRYEPGRLDGMEVDVPLRLEVVVPAGTAY